MRGLRLVVIILAIFGSACQMRAGIRDADLPVIVVDDAHNHIGPAKTGKREEYAIAPAPGFVLDATGYVFTVPPKSPSTSPNAVQVIIAKDKAYTLQWLPSRSRYQVSSTTLMPLRGSSRFERLEAGSTVVIGIGYQQRESDRIMFHAFWAGLVKVQPAAR